MAEASEAGWPPFILVLPVSATLSGGFFIHIILLESIQNCAMISPIKFCYQENYNETKDNKVRFFSLFTCHGRIYCPRIWFWYFACFQRLLFLVGYPHVPHHLCRIYAIRGRRSARRRSFSDFSCNGHIACQCQTPVLRNFHDQ